MRGLARRVWQAGKTGLRSVKNQTFISAETDTDVRSQFGALCWRRNAGVFQVLLITSRDTGRWIIPKGWPMEGKSPEAAAAQEAFEEAGVCGEVLPQCIGFYSYDKGLDKPSDGPSHVPCVVAVYPLQVSKLADDFPERHERRRKWFTPKKAAGKVSEPELQHILEAAETLVGADVDLGDKARKN